MFSDASGYGPAGPGGAGDAVSRLFVNVLVDPASHEMARMVLPSERGWTPVGPQVEMPGGPRIAMVPTSDHYAAVRWWSGLVQAATAAGLWHGVAAGMAGGWMPGSGQ